jgi:hypothetical protein
MKCKSQTISMHKTGKKQVLWLLVWPVLLAQSFTMSSSDLSFQNLVFFEFIWIFSGREII